MILKAYETNKIDINKNNLVLFYGENQGVKEEEISKILRSNKNKTLVKYEEQQILENIEVFYNEILSGSLFESQKIFIINRATEKILKIIEDLLEKNIQDISIIINSHNLEKKSKLRGLFEKNKNLICVAFYHDNNATLSKIAYQFLRDENIIISQSNINLIVNKCNGDRGILKNELEKISSFTQNGKKISTENILRLINLIENFSIGELVDNCLAKNQKKTISILSENNYNNEDCMIITRTFLNKLKKILSLSKSYEINKNLDQTISNAKPPIFWKDKEIVKQQIYKLSPDKIYKLIFDINEIELQIKKNANNSVNIISNFILEKATVN